jgi:hypothetical protein
MSSLPFPHPESGSLASHFWGANFEGIEPQYEG